MPAASQHGDRQGSSGQFREFDPIGAGSPPPGPTRSAIGNAHNTYTAPGITSSEAPLPQRSDATGHDDANGNLAALSQASMKT